MKRLWVLFLALCTAMLSCVGVLIPSAEGANTDIWSVYSLLEDQDGNPYFGTAPAYEYTEEGLRVTPPEEIESYTIQTDHAYRMDDGLYMEIKLDQTVDAGMLVFHIWDQSGFILSNLNCGSGWQGMLQLNRNETQLMLSAYVRGSTPDKEGQDFVMGSMKLPAPVTEDGSVTYSLSLKDDILRINDRVVGGMEDVLSLLRDKTDGGNVYFGVSAVMSPFGGPIPITVTRFGTSQEDASVPGTDGQPSETGGEAPETLPSSPVETVPSEPTETNPPADQETENSESQTPPNGGQETTPSETVSGSNGSDTESEKTTRDENDDPYGDPETEAETRKEIHNEKVDNFMEKLENMGGCGSVVGMGGVGFSALLAAAYWSLRKKS